MQRQEHNSTESRLKELLSLDITDNVTMSIDGGALVTISSKSEKAQSLGFTNLGTGEVTLHLTSSEDKVGAIRLQANSDGNEIYLDNRRAGNLHGNFRFLGSDNLIFINDLQNRYVAIHDAFLRGNNQFIYWGAGASSVGISVEIEGAGCGVIVGDDALISSGVWIRNHDMHTVFDLKTNSNISTNPVTTIIERHVWLGQDVLLLKCDRIGKGAILGARSLVSKPVPAMTAMAGIPARAIRESVTWGRDANAISMQELQSLGVH